MEAISQHFDNIDWDKVLMPLNANNSYEYFLEEYQKCCESFVPLRKLRKSNDRLRMKKTLRTRIKEKHRLWFKLKAVSRTNSVGRSELQNQ